MRLTVAALRTKNPWLHKSDADFEKEIESSEFIVQDSEDSPEGFFPLCQMCSIMAVYWVKDEVGDNSSFNSVSSSRQQTIVRVAAANPTNEAQFDWAASATRYTEIAIEKIPNLTKGARLLLYGPRHVTALEVIAPWDTEQNCRVYDPENATTTFWNLAHWINLSEATKVLSSTIP
jgi:hypothetical protein